MSHNRKKSIIVLGNGKYLKEALITSILGKDLSQVRRKSGQFNIYEYEDLEITCSPDHDDIQGLFARTRHPDLCLLVVEVDFSTTAVWDQIEDMSKATGKATEDFIVVPLGFQHSYTLQLCTFDQHFTKRINNTDDKGQTQPNSRFADDCDANISAGVGCSTDPNTRWLTVTTVNLVLLGQSGTGKSSSGNTILGERRFMSTTSSEQSTTECQAAETWTRRRRVRVIDTPDIFDELDKSVKDKHVSKCRELCQSEPCVYLLVMSVGRFTDGERNVLKKLEEAFGKEAPQQTLILFTRGDSLKYDGTTEEMFLNHCQKELKNIVDGCERRCVVFDNKDKNPHQVEKLMETVEKMLENQIY